MCKLGHSQIINKSRHQGRTPTEKIFTFNLAMKVDSEDSIPKRENKIEDFT